MREFNSIYAEFLRGFIQYKRNLGYKFKDEETKYSDMDRFFSSLGETNVGITQELAKKWALRRPNESDSNRYRRVMYLVKFSQYLNDIGVQSYIPSYPSAYKSTFTPYIFTQEEIDKVLHASDTLGVSHSQETCADAVPVILRVLYGTGIRIGEAVALMARDVDLEKRFLIVRQSKSGRQRKLPFKESVAVVCREYRKKVDASGHGNSYFFIKRNGRPCREKTIYEWFRVVLRKAGIHHCGKGQGPRLHDVRHTFCVHALAAMANDGLDLYYTLPILSEYLGHQSLWATEKYVRLTSEMYPSLLEGAGKVFGSVFPEVYDNETD